MEAQLFKGTLAVWSCDAGNQDSVRGSDFVCRWESSGCSQAGHLGNAAGCCQAGAAHFCTAQVQGGGGLTNAQGYCMHGAFFRQRLRSPHAAKPRPLCWAGLVRLHTHLCT